MRISDWSSDVCSSDLSSPGCVERSPKQIRRGHSFVRTGLPPESANRSCASRHLPNGRGSCATAQAGKVRVERIFSETQFGYQPLTNGDSCVLLCEALLVRWSAASTMLKIRTASCGERGFQSVSYL